MLGAPAPVMLPFQAVTLRFHKSANLLQLNLMIRHYYLQFVLVAWRYVWTLDSLDPRIVLLDIVYEVLLCIVRILTLNIRCLRHFNRCRFCFTRFIHFLLLRSWFHVLYPGQIYRSLGGCRLSLSNFSWQIRWCFAVSLKGWLLNSTWDFYYLPEVIKWKLLLVVGATR